MADQELAPGVWISPPQEDGSRILRCGGRSYRLHTTKYGIPGRVRLAPFEDLKVADIEVTEI